MLPARVWMPSAPNPSTEDIFSGALSTLFTDDTQNSHGIPGQSVIYDSPRYGKIQLGIPQHPEAEEGRDLFAHYLWNAGVVAADAIEVASHDDNAPAPEESKVNWNKKYWDMRGRDVLELGAGTALPSLISALSSAKSVTITDHPSSPALTADTVAHNIHHNLNINLLVSNSGTTQDNEPRTNTTLSIHGLAWGTTTFTSPTVYGKPSNPQPAQHSFDRIIVADCLWMPGQHANLVKTINDYLKPHDEQWGGGDKACALVIAGFHTGRSVVARFVEIATGSRSGNIVDNETGQHEQESAGDREHEPVKEAKGTLAAEEIFEIDVDANVRPWRPVREDENKDQAKKWCICAVLVRK